MEPQVLATAQNSAPLVHSSFPLGQRLIKGAGSSALRQIIGVIEPILLVPLFLSAWGAEGYGRWLAISALVSYFSLLDFGAQTYTANLLAIEHARGNAERFRLRLSEAVSLFLFVTMVGALAILVLASGILRNIELPMSLTRDERWVIIILTANVLVAMPGGIYGTVYQACGLFSRGMMLGNLLRFSGLLVGAAALYAALTPPYYAGIVLATCAVLTTILLWDSRRNIPECRGLTISFANAWHGLRLLPGSFHFWLLSLSQSLKTQGLILVAAAVGTPALVSLYVTHRTLANLASYVTSLIQGPLFPELSALAARGQSIELRQISFTAMKLSILATGGIAVILWVAVPTLYPLWIGKQLAWEPMLFTLMLIHSVLAAGWSTASWPLQAANRHRAVAYWTIGNALITLTVAGFLFTRFGLVGVVLATLIGDILCGLAIFPTLASSLLGTEPSAIYRSMMPATAGVLILVPVAYAASTTLRPLYATAVVLVILVSLAYPIGCFVLGTATMQRFAGLLKAFIADIRPGRLDAKLATPSSRT